MEVELLESGIGVLEAEPTALSNDDAASQLVEQILSQRRTSALRLKHFFLWQRRIGAIQTDQYPRPFANNCARASVILQPYLA